MRRFIMLVTVVLLMTAMLVVASASPALAAVIPFKGVPVDPAACEGKKLSAES